MGVRPEIHPARVRALRHEGIPVGHEQRADQRQGQTDKTHRLVRPHTQQNGQQKRPHEVVLLFNGQGPQVLEYAGVLNAFKIRLLRIDLPPIRQIKSEGQVGNQAGVGLGRKVRGQPGTRHHHRRKRRKQAVKAAHEKRDQRNPPRALLFGQQQSCDQKPRDHEEQVHP